LNVDDLLLDIDTYGGRALFDRDFTHFRIIASRKSPTNCVDDFHGHSYAYFSWNVKGLTYEEFEDGSSRENTPWLTGFHPLSERHRSQIKKPTTVMAVRLKPSFRKKLEHKYGPFPNSTVLNNSLAIELGQWIFKEAWSQDSVSSLVLEGLVHQLVGELYREMHRSNQPTEQWLVSLGEKMERNWKEPLDLAKIALEFDLHPNYISRAFARHFGRTLSEQKSAIRLRHAARILTTSELSVASIAAECGYYDEAHFSRAFKKRFGTSPGKYRLSR
jgi:AraC-like DNA-binding protein